MSLLTLKNSAGGLMEAMTPEEKLAKLATTTLITSKTRAVVPLTEFINTAKLCSPEFVAQTAIYAYCTAFMKDSAVVLLGTLLARKEHRLFNEAAPHILDNLGTIKKFISFVRSGDLGFKSLGTAAKNVIKEYLVSTDPVILFTQDYGTPTLKDIISLTHPKPPASHEQYFAWLYNKKSPVPSFLEEYKLFLESKLTTRLPRHVPGILLLNYWHRLSSEQKDLLITKSSWSQIRTNYNRFAEHNKELTDTKLLEVDTTVFRKDLDSLMITWRNINYSKVFEEALINSMQFRPQLTPDIKVQIFIDNSGSMSRHQNLYKAGWLARFLATPLTTVYLFDTEVHSKITIDNLFQGSIKTLKTRGCTEISSIYNHIDEDTQLVIVLSDNETWVENKNYTSVKKEYDRFRASTGSKAKFVFWDLDYKPMVPVNDKLTLNMSGLNTQLINTITNFALEDKSLVEQISAIKV